MWSDEMISVIVPVYNVEKYLDRCITSIVNQTYENLEIILVNDGSRDSSGAICDRYAREDKRIRVIHKENGGLSDARNAGLTVCQGAYIAFADSDDSLDPKMLELLYRALKEHGVQMSMCNAFMVNEDYERIPGWNALGPIEYGILTKEAVLWKLFQDLGGYYVVSWNKLYQRSLFDQVRFPVGRVNEDEYVIHRLLGQCREVACIEDALYFYLQRGGSIMSKIKKGSEVTYLFNQAAYMLDRMRYLKAHSMDRHASEAYRKCILLSFKLGDLKRAGALSGRDCHRLTRFQKILKMNWRLGKKIKPKKKLRLLVNWISPGLYNSWYRLRER